MMSSVCILILTTMNVFFPAYSDLPEITPNIVLLASSLIIIFGFNYFSIHKITPIYKEISKPIEEIEKNEEENLNN